jgi:nitrite reductase/ring-hydroxylating ferredoxin subunit
MVAVKLEIKKNDLKEGKPIKVEASGKNIMLVLLSKKVYAIDSICSHRGGPLEQGKMEGKMIVCPWHGAKYDVTTGKVDPSTNWGKFQQSFEVSESPNGELSIEI